MPVTFCSGEKENVFIRRKRSIFVGITSQTAGERKQHLPLRYKTYIVYIAVALVITGGCWYAGTRINFNTKPTPGEPVDELDGVTVYYKGAVSHTQGRHLTTDGYNQGLRYQCVEFVKRYYYEHYGYRIPDTYGHARSFFDPSVAHGQWNSRRGLYQYRNQGTEKPRKGDLLVWCASVSNLYRHVAIAASVGENSVEVVQHRIRVLSVNRLYISASYEVYRTVRSMG